MLPRAAWRTLLRLLDDPHQAGFAPDLLRQWPGGRELLASGLLQRFDVPYLTVEGPAVQTVVDYFPGADRSVIQYACPDTGQLVAADPRHVVRYRPDLQRMAAILQQHLGIPSSVRVWSEDLYWLGEAVLNDRTSTVLFDPTVHRAPDALLPLFSRAVVRTPAILLHAGTRKTPFCWSGGWGIALPIEQCLRDEPAATAVLDRMQIAVEVRRPHQDIARRLVEFDWSSHTLRIAGLGEFPIAKGEAAAVVQRLAEAVWLGEEMVALAELRKAARADSTKRFKEMMGRTAHWNAFVRNPQQGYYALRIGVE